MKVELSDADLEPIVTRVVDAVLKRRASIDANLGSELCYTEQEAADVLKMTGTQLRDIRKRGDIEHVIISGRFIRYRRRDIERFLDRHAARNSE